jgi:hypothetical protein
MKICRNIISNLSVVTASLALACWPGAAHAQTTTILLPPGAIQINGSPTDTNIDWGIFWDGYGPSGFTNPPAGGSATEVYTNGFSSSDEIPGSIHVTLLFSGDVASNAVTGPNGGAANLAVGDFITTNLSMWSPDQANDLDFSQYSALSFDIYVNINTSSNSAIPISLYDWYGAQVQIGSVPIPTTNGWQHFSFPIGYNFSFFDANAPSPSGTAWGFYNWYQNTPPGCEEFWIDNVQLVGAPAPPQPKLMPPVKTTPGLNVFASTEANSVWDEQQVMLLANTGLSWVGRASAAKPVSYSFAIDGFDTNSVWAAEAYLFLIPNSPADPAPDWDEANGITISVNCTGNNGGTMNFTYKVNEPQNDLMYWSNPPYTNAPGSCAGATNCFETGNLCTVYSATLFGTWTVSFTSDTNGTLIAPDGTTTNFIFPSYNVGYFAETNGFNVYLGFEANNTNAINQAVVYSSFAVTNVPSECSDNFLTDTSLNTNLWTSSYSAGPEGVFIVPSNAPLMLAWTSPANGFSLAESPILGPNAVWNNVSTYLPIPMYGLSQQVISTNDLTSTKAEFFALIKRAFTQLLVVLPGETYAPGTATGKTGTPTSVSLGNNSGEEDVTVYAVDPKFYPVSGVTDSISLTTTDLGASGILPPGQTMVNGVATFNLANAPETFLFFDAGTWTITATDTTDTNIPPATSASVTVGP